MDPSMLCHTDRQKSRVFPYFYSPDICVEIGPVPDASTGARSARTTQGVRRASKAPQKTTRFSANIDDIGTPPFARPSIKLDEKHSFSLYGSGVHYMGTHEALHIRHIPTCRSSYGSGKLA